MSCSMLSGVSVGAKRLTTLPSRSIKNFVKFHLMDEPSALFFSFLRNLKRSLAFLPLTSIFAKRGNVVP